MKKLTTTEARRTIAYVVSGELMSEGRPSGTIETEQVSHRRINVWFYADGSASLLVFRPEDEQDGDAHGVRVELPAPMGERLRAALVTDDLAEWDALTLAPEPLPS